MVAVSQRTIVLTDTDVEILYRLAGLDVTVPEAIREISRPELADAVDDLFDRIRKTVDASGINPLF